MQNTMKQARAEYRRTFSHVVESINKEGEVTSRTRSWSPDAPGLRGFVRANRSKWAAPVGKLASIIAALALFIGCAPAEHDITPEAGPQAGAASVDVGVNAEALVPCTAANICDALKSAVRAELNYRCGSGWSKPSGSCSSTWTATAPGRSATITRVSSTQRYVSASQCSAFTQACYCGSDGHILCD